MDEQGITVQAEKYKFCHCNYNDSHTYYQLNETCLVKDCPYYLIPYCKLCNEEEVYGQHGHKGKALKEMFQTLAQQVEDKKSKSKVEANQQLLEISNKLRTIAQQCMDLSEEALQTARCTKNAKIIFSCLKQIFAYKSIDILKTNLFKMSNAVELVNNQVTLTPISIQEVHIFQSNFRKESERILNEIQSLRDQLVDTLPKELPFNFSQTLTQKQPEFLKSPSFGKFLNVPDKNIFEGTQEKIQLIYSPYTFNSGVQYLNIKILSYGENKGHLYVGLIKDQGKDQGSHYFSTYHCLFCQEGNEIEGSLDWVQQVSFAKKDSYIVLEANIDMNTFNIRAQSGQILYTKKNNFLLQGTHWRFGIWFGDSTVRIQIP